MPSNPYITKLLINPYLKPTLFLKFKPKPKIKNQSLDNPEPQN